MMDADMMIIVDILSIPELLSVENKMIVKSTKL